MLPYLLFRTIRDVSTLRSCLSWRGRLKRPWASTTARPTTSTKRRSRTFEAMSNVTRTDARRWWERCRRTTRRLRRTAATFWAKTSTRESRATPAAATRALGFIAFTDSRRRWRRWKATSRRRWRGKERSWSSSRRLRAPETLSNWPKFQEVKRNNLFRRDRLGVLCWIKSARS